MPPQALLLGFCYHDGVIRFIEGPPGEGNTAAFHFLDRHTGADWRKKTCNAKSATAGGRLRVEMYTTDLANVVIFTYVCDVTSATGEYFSITSWQMQGGNAKRSLKMHSIGHIMRNGASQEGI